MGYLSIENLYRAKDVLQCYALEKIHGTSANVSFDNGKVSYFPGEVNIETFKCLFDNEKLEARASKVTAVVYGEAFGGKVQAMGHIYGNDIRFLAFDVQVNGKWLDVPNAEKFAKSLGIGFVSYVKVPLSIEALDAERDRPSTVGIFQDTPREGVVIRPIQETEHKGKRWIFKHKRDDFRETATPRIFGEGLLTLSDPVEIAKEWVTPMRLSHVLQKVQPEPYWVTRGMIEDIRKESEGEIEWSHEAENEIRKATLELMA